MPDELELKVGATYRAKRPRRMFNFVDGDHFNDRTIIWIGLCEVQYDGPAVKIGSKYPKVTIEAFRKWAGKMLPDHEETSHA